MNKEMITRRAFAGLAAGGAASTLAACNSDVMQAILNPDSILGVELVKILRMAVKAVLVMHLLSQIL